MERTARTALAEVREAIGGYRSKGLNAEVEQARLTLLSAGVALSCETRPPALPAREETVLSLAVREAVTNIVRHAHATQCTMRFATTADGFASFEVADNGAAGAGRRGQRHPRHARARAGAGRTVPHRARAGHDAGNRAAAHACRCGMIKVVLAEDQAMVLGALAALLALEPDITVLATAANGRDALRAAEQLAPDVLVTDIEMPGMTGLEVATALKLSRPNVRCVILTTFARPGYLRRGARCGGSRIPAEGPARE